MILPDRGSGQLARAAALVPEYQVPAESYLLASSLEELRRSNAAAEPHADGGPTRVGLRLVPDAFDDGTVPGVRVSELPRLAPEIRALRGVTVRGCFVRGRLDGLHGKELGRFFRESYESAKRMSAILPCAMPYLCAEGALAALAYNRAEHPETLHYAVTAAQIVAAQNQTAFYAKLLIC